MGQKRKAFLYGRFVGEDAAGATDERERKKWSIVVKRERETDRELTTYYFLPADDILD